MATGIGSRGKARWKSVLDFLAVAGPIICLIDCVVLPVLSALLPFIGMTDIGHGINDQALVFLVLAICLPIIVPGFLKHRSTRVLSMFVSAIVLMLFVNFTGIVVDEIVHAAISLTAAFLLIKANRENKKLLTCACSFHHHAPVPHETVHAHAHAHSAASSFNQVVFVQNEHSHDQHHDHVHDHDGPCLHEVVVALEMQDHGLDPNHFEPRHNLSLEPLNFEPQVVAADHPTVPLAPIVVAPVSCC